MLCEFFKEVAYVILGFTFMKNISHWSQEHKSSASFFVAKQTFLFVDPFCNFLKCIFSLFPFNFLGQRMNNV